MRSWILASASIKPSPESPMVFFLSWARLYMGGGNYGGGGIIEVMSSTPHSDALILFGATGDLAFKQIFPALQALTRRGHLEMPVIIVARSGWNLDQLKARMKESLEQHGGLDSGAFARLAARVQY